MLQTSTQIVSNEQRLLMSDAGLLASEWDSLRFVDVCSDARRRHGKVEDLCRHIARLEWQLLFDYCWCRATGQAESC